VSCFGDEPSPALLEGWFVQTSHRHAKPSQVFVRLTADAVLLYETSPSQPELSKAELLAPTEVVLLSKVTSLLGRGKTSNHVRLDDVRNRWWDFRIDPPSEIEPLLNTIGERLDRFRSAQSMASFKVNLTVVEEELKCRKRREESLMKRLGRCCCPCLFSDDPVHGDFSTEVVKMSKQGARKHPFRGRLSYHGTFMRDQGLAQHSDVDVQEAQAVHWSQEAVSFLKTVSKIPEGLLPDFQHSVRKGVPDSLKRTIWALAANAPGASDCKNGMDLGKFHKSVLERAFGTSVPETFMDPVPTFCEGLIGFHEAPPLTEVVKYLSLLTPEGEAALRRLLWCVQLTTHSVELCPFLPNLIACLLLFFDESETMLLVQTLINKVANDTRSDKDTSPALVLNRKMLNVQAKIFVRIGKKKSVAGEVFAHLEHIGVDVDALALRLLRDGLAHTLPFRAFCRLVGSVLAEGSDVILRYGIAVLKLQQPALLACKTAAEAEQLLADTAKTVAATPDVLEKLSRLAFSFNLSGITGLVSSGWLTGGIAPNANVPLHIFCRPRLFEPRGNCPDRVWEKIWAWVPDSCRIFDPHLVYLPAQHGTSMRTCLEKCKKHSDCPMVFFVYSLQGDIIGGFSPSMMVRTSGAYLDVTSMRRTVDDAFVFRSLRGNKGAADIYMWSGRNNFLLQASELSDFVFGGDSPAIQIGVDMLKCTTAKSETFASPSLLAKSTATGSGSDYFEMARFEVFALY